VEQIQNPKSKILKPSDLSVGSIQNPKSKIQNRMTPHYSQYQACRCRAFKSYDTLPSQFLTPLKVFQGKNSPTSLPPGFLFGSKSQNDMAW
jgi:hypothetical protein